MAQTVANLGDVLKEAWTSDRLEKQFYDENPLLDRFAKFEAEMVKSKIGEKAIVPIHKGRSGGSTTTLAAGGALNAADEQKVDACEYTLIYNWFQIDVETGVLNQATGSGSVVDGKDLEIKGAIADMKASCSRQAVSNGDGIIAQCDSGGASTTVELHADGYGYDAIVRGWLYPGQLVTIGAAGDADEHTANGSIIASVTESPTDPDIVIADSISTADHDFVGVYNPNSATLFSPELNGLRQIAGSTSLAVGSLDPDTAGEGFWKPAHVDTTTTVFSLDLALELQRKVHQKTGSLKSCEQWTSLKQQSNFYSLLQNQVRFTGDGNIGAGNDSATKWNGMAPHAIPDIPDREWYQLTMDNFFVVTGQGITKPTWASDLEGSGGRLRWNQGNTNFVDGVVYPFNIAVNRRNSHAAAIGLTA